MGVQCGGEGISVRGEGRVLPGAYGTWEASGEGLNLLAAPPPRTDVALAEGEQD